MKKFVVAAALSCLLPALAVAQVQLDYSGTTNICQGDQTTLSYTLSDPGQTCTFYLELNDAGGDGWNGTTVDVIVNGALSLSTTVTNGFQHIDTLTFMQGDSVDFIYNSFNFEFDNSFGGNAWNWPFANASTIASATRDAGAAISSSPAALAMSVAIGPGCTLTT